MNKKTTTYSWVVLVLLWFAAAVSPFAQYQLSVFAPDIMGTMGLSASQFSSLFTAPMVPAIFLSVIAGVLADKIGPKALVGIGLVVSGLGAAARIYAGGYGVLWISMLMLGLSSTFTNCTSSKILGRWFTTDKLVIALGIFTTGGTLAQTLGSATAGYFGGMKIAFTAAAILFVICAVLWILFMKNAPKADIAEASAGAVSAETDANGKGGVKAVLTNRGIWLVCICIMMILGCTVTLSQFMATALNERYGIDMAVGGTLAGMISFGNMIGALAGPLVYAKFRSTRAYVSFVGFASFICAFTCWRVSSVGLLYVLLVITGIFLGAAMPLFFSAPMNIRGIDMNCVGTAAGIIATCQLLAAVAIPTFILTPIAGTNYSLLFTMASGLMLVMGVLGLLFPDFKDKAA